MCDAWQKAHTHTFYALDDRQQYDHRKLPPLLERHPKACADAPRSIFIDAGASWCNSLQLYRHIPGVPRSGKLNVFAFEVSPLIMPFVERCAEALSRGEPLPPQPLPPSGSSSQLLKYAVKVGCHHGSRGGQFVCIEKALNATLQALRPDSRLLGNHSLVWARLNMARTAGLSSCDTVGTQSMGPSSATYHLIPAGFGVRDATMQVADSARGLMQLLRGGASISSKEGAALSSGRPQSSVPVIDALRWLRHSFTVDDYVVLKMDVEGAENEIVPALLATNTSKLIDVLLWECHLAVNGGIAGKCRCSAWERALLASGVRRVYRDPYPFAQASDYPEFVVDAVANQSAPPSRGVGG